MMVDLLFSSPTKKTTFFPAYPLIFPKELKKSVKKKTTMTNIHKNYRLIPKTRDLLLSCTTINSNTIDTNGKAGSVKYDFEVSPYRGKLVGKYYYGSFSFNGSELIGKVIEFIKLENFDFSFLGIDYSKTDLLFAYAVFRESNFLGLTVSGEHFSFICGFFDLSEASFAYNINFSFGVANVTFSLRKVTFVL